LVATAAGPQHYLALDTSGRALVASLDGFAVPTVVYATSADIVDGVAGDEVVARLRQAMAEAARVAGAAPAWRPASSSVPVRAARRCWSGSWPTHRSWPVRRRSTST